ncbi:MAG: hypothetical protein ABI895_22745 [Deltaproteobacteria bacterium]
MELPSTSGKLVLLRAHGRPPLDAAALLVTPLLVIARTDLEIALRPASAQDLAAIWLDPAHLEAHS